MKTISGSVLTWDVLTFKCFHSNYHCGSTILWLSCGQLIVLKDTFRNTFLTLREALSQQQKLCLACFDCEKFRTLSTVFPFSNFSDNEISGAFGRKEN